MPVNDTSIKLRNGWGGTNELELKPNLMSEHAGSLRHANKVTVIMREKLDDDAKEDKTLAVEVDIDELTNALELIKQSHFEGAEGACCGECGRP